MLYNSFPFILFFLPVCLIGYALASFLRTSLPQLLWLAIMSCVFYAYWNALYLILLLGSLAINFCFAQAQLEKRSRPLLVFAIAFNLAVLGYFKYRVFVLANAAALASFPMDLPQLVLPLGISFFTFQKIAYQIDIYRGRVTEGNFLRYAVFITFFPQLIAGPIVHYGPLMRQFPPARSRRLHLGNLNVGIAFFIIGLVKKVVIADNLAPYSDGLFSAAEGSVSLGFFEAWLAALAYSFQIYFDFSGYSDMAIGLARMFGIRLPVNFNSPYKARSFIEFWRRWHITLSQFLRDYLYIPLGGNRHGLVPQSVSILVTMALGGLWHGASWTFVLWGALHGGLLVANHVWRRFRQVGGLGWLDRAAGYEFLCLIATSIAVGVLWVLFRAPTLAGSMFVFRGLAGLNGFGANVPEYVLQSVPINGIVQSILDVFLPANSWPLVSTTAGVICGVLLVMVWVFPNSQQIMSYRTPLHVGSRWRWLRWRPSALCFLAVIALFYVSLVCMVKLTIRPFTYFAF